MDFGEALRECKSGSHIAREGWNGKGMYIMYQKGYPDGIACNKQTAEAAGLNEGDLFKCAPYLQMKGSDGTFFMWTPNTLDILADDWMVIK